MSQPTHGPKLLRRSRTDRYVGGVCGGVAAYLNMDPTLVRILTVVITLFTGAPVILYLVALFFMPEEDVTPAAPVGQVGDPVWGAGGPPWAQAPGAQPPTPAWTTPDATPTPAPEPSPVVPNDPPRREDGTV
jgi:phage shock protein PspC (stress-responsive transcriptional regulator)